MGSQSIWQADIRTWLRIGEAYGEYGPAAKKWEITTFLIAEAVVALQETPPPILYHGLNGVKLDSDINAEQFFGQKFFWYNNLISTAPDPSIARSFASGTGGTVAEPASAGTIISFQTESFVPEEVPADMQWLSKFPDEREWLVRPSGFFLLDKFEIEPEGGIVHVSVRSGFVWI